MNPTTPHNFLRYPAMARPNLNDRTNQLRVEGTYDDLYWPRYLPKRDEQTKNVRHVCYVSLIAFVLALVLEGLRVYLLTPLAVLLLVFELLRWINRKFYSDDIVKPAGSVLTAAPFITTWLLAAAIPVVAYSIHPRLWEASLFTIAPLVACYFSYLLTKHYLAYLTAHHALSASTQAKWNDAFEHLWKSFRVVEPRHAELTNEQRKMFKQAVAAFGNYRRRLFAAWLMPLIAAVTYVVFPLPLPPFIPTVMVAATFLALVAAAYVGRPAMRTTWHAVQSYFNTPKPVKSSEHSPWSPVGPVGSTQHRRERLIVTITLISCCMLPLTTYPMTATTKHLESFQPYSLHANAEHPSQRGAASIATIIAAIADGQLSSVALLLVTGFYSSVFSFGFLFLLIHFVSGPSIHYARELLDDEF